MLDVSNSSKDSVFNLALQEILSRALKISGCQSAGIRLRKNGDFPFYIHEGLPGFFVQKEDSLLIKSKDKQFLSDENGCWLLDCMCGNVIRGHFNSNFSFFSKKGSFWTNSTSDLLLTITSEQKRFIGPTRNLCNLSGYESVALIPLIIDQNIIGLLHLADPRENMFSDNKIYSLELVTDEFANIIKCVYEIAEKLSGIDETIRFSNV